MSTEFSPVYGSALALAFAAGDATLVAGGYAVASAVQNNTAPPALDFGVQIAAGLGSISGDQTLAVFVQTSLDGITWSDAPADGSTDSSRDASMHLIGSFITLNAATTFVTPLLSIAARIGFVPPYFRIVVKNDTGAAFTSLAGKLLPINLQGA